MLTTINAVTHCSAYMKMSCLLLKVALLICFHFVTKSHALGIASRPATTRVSTAYHLNNANSDSLTLFSPCKINLFLRIIRKRDDGYHELASLFQAIGFGDTLELSVLQDSDSDEFECNMPGVPVDQTNLVLRALTLMREKTSSNVHFKANLIKSVPAQAGLGGGSANAATAMYGANELMGRPATLDQVRNYAALLCFIYIYSVCYGAFSHTIHYCSCFYIYSW